jgi:hypothetical protein
LFPGTGFFITDDGYLISNYHVVKDATKVRLLTSVGLIDAKVVQVGETAALWIHGFLIKLEPRRQLSCWICCARKIWRGFCNFVPEFFIDAEARGGRISRLVHNFI